MKGRGVTRRGTRRLAAEVLRSVLRIIAAGRCVRVDSLHAVRVYSLHRQVVLRYSR